MKELMPSTRPPSDGDRKVRDEVRAFIRESLALGRFVPRIDSWAVGWDPDFSAELGKRGLVGMTIPVAYGGRGSSYVERYIVIEELLAAGAPVAAHWIADRQAAPSLLAHGSDFQKNRFLPGIAAGTLYFGIGMSESGSGSDLASVRTKASKVPGGWLIKGTKIWTSGAHRAHAFFVLARTSTLDPKRRHEGLSQFIVTLDSPAIDIRPIRSSTGQHHFNEVALDGVFVPDEMLLGSEGDGWQQVTAELSFERSGPERLLSSFPLLAKFLETLVVNADLRASGGVALGAMLNRAFVLRQMSFAIAHSLTNGVDVGLSAAIVKDLGTRFEREVVEKVAEACALAPEESNSDLPFGDMLDDSIHQSLGFTLRGGTNEVLRGLIARELGLK